MSKPLAASKNVMKTYLSELLSDDEHEFTKSPKETIKKRITAPAPSLQEHKRLETLLENVNTDIESAVKDVETKKSIATKEYFEVEDTTVIEDETVKSLNQDHGEFIEKPPKNYRQGDFQALFFNVAGLTIAVPLIDLGGIHQVDKTTSLMGKPPWFKGVMLHRDEKINVVDTALWVMPEKYDEALKNSLNYEYIIMLSDSVWGLSAENLVDTVVLQQDEVKWLENSNKRPWLAGLVKDKMCALLDVDSLIELLNEGSGINQLD